MASAAIPAAKATNSLPAMRRLAAPVNWETVAEAVVVEATICPSLLCCTPDETAMVEL